MRELYIKLNAAAPETEKGERRPGDMSKHCRLDRKKRSEQRKAEPSGEG